MITGALLVEVTFTLPGIGSLLVGAVRPLDIPVVQGLALLSPCSWCWSTWSSTCCTPLDPRVRYGRVESDGDAVAAASPASPGARGLPPTRLVLSPRVRRAAVVGAAFSAAIAPQPRPAGPADRGHAAQRRPLAGYRPAGAGHLLAAPFGPGRRSLGRPGRARGLRSARSWGCPPATSAAGPMPSSCAGPTSCTPCRACWWRSWSWASSAAATPRGRPAHPVLVARHPPRARRGAGAALASVRRRRAGAGRHPRRIMLRHIWPNVVPVIVVNTCLTSRSRS